MISRMPPKKQLKPAQKVSSTEPIPVSAGGGAVSSKSGKKRVVIQSLEDDDLEIPIQSQPIGEVSLTGEAVPGKEVKDEDEADVEDDDDVFGPDEEEDVDEEEVVDDVEKDEEDEQKEDDEDEDEEDEEEEDEDGNIRRKPKKKGKKASSNSAQGNAVIGLGAVEDIDEEPVLMDDDYIERVHPEMILPDTKELQEIMRSYTRDEKPVQRKSRPILSKYEATSIIGMRAQQIIRGSTPFIDSTEVNPIDIALEELRAKLIPIIVRRVMPDGVSEYWRLTELTYYE